MPIRVTQAQLRAQLNILTHRGDIVSADMEMSDIVDSALHKKVSIYTLPQYSIYFRKRLSRQAISKDKMKMVSRFISVAKRVPFVAFLGISGSVAMANAKKNDDVDLFVVSSPGRMWICRLLLLCIAQVFGLRRSRGLRYAPHTVCMNLFFDGADLEIPAEKQSLFTAHELLQMKLVWNKHDTYKKLLAANTWILKFLPNHKISKQIKNYQNSTIGLLNYIEQCARFVQMKLIQKHKTSEYITTTQAWFFPRDASHVFRRKKI